MGKGAQGEGEDGFTQLADGFKSSQAECCDSVRFFHPVFRSCCNHSKTTQGVVLEWLYIQYSLYTISVRPLTAAIVRPCSITTVCSPVPRFASPSACNRAVRAAAELRRQESAKEDRRALQELLESRAESALETSVTVAIIRGHAYS